MTKQELSSTEKHYRATIEGLVNVLFITNAPGHTGDDHGWVIDADVGDAHNNIYYALVKLAGQEFVDYWCSTNEIMWELADRSEHRTFKCSKCDDLDHRGAVDGDTCDHCFEWKKQELLDDEAEVKRLRNELNDEDADVADLQAQIAYLKNDIEKNRLVVWELLAQRAERAGKEISFTEQMLHDPLFS